MADITATLMSKRHDWETPHDFFEMINEEFNFTLDVCAFPHSAKCEKYFTPEIDGLSKNWGGMKSAG